jgi:sarcosine oxidase, subunit beta
MFPPRAPFFCELRVVFDDEERAGKSPGFPGTPSTRHDARAAMSRGQRIVIAGAGAIGSSIAYHLALLGAQDVVLADLNEVASGATGKAMGGFRQQFSTAAEVRLAQESAKLFRELGAPLFEAVGYVFVATTEEGLARMRARAAMQRDLGVPVDDVDPSRVRGLRTDDVLGAVACWDDGVAEPEAIAHELVRRAAELGVDVRLHTDVRELDGDVLVIACGASSPKLCAALPIRPLCRQLVDVGPVTGLPGDLPMTIEEETGFHFRRHGAALRLAMTEPTPRWTEDELVDELLVADWRKRLAYRYPSATGTPVIRAWAGLYDMTPDAHPIVGFVGDGVYAACGFSGHGFMQSPAVGRAVAEELLRGESELDLSSYRLDRFAGDAVFPETLVL